MATWFSASQLLLIALLSWNVLCRPSKTGWSQPDPPDAGGLSNMAMHPGFHYRSSQGAPAQTSSVSYPAVEEGVYSSPGTYPAVFSPTPDMSSKASWNAAPGWDPVEGSTTAYTASIASQPIPNIGLLPPPVFQAGELNHYEANLERGNSERETGELSYPVPPLPYPGYQAGELSHYTSILEHGNQARETEERGFMPPPPYASAPLGVEVSAPLTLVPAQPVPPRLPPVGPSEYYRFLTGQLLPGTYSHFQSDYEEGGDHWDEAHYERYHFPTLLQQPQDYTKT